MAEQPTRLLARRISLILSEETNYEVNTKQSIPPERPHTCQHTYQVQTKTTALRFGYFIIIGGNSKNVQGAYSDCDLLVTEGIYQF